MFRARLIASLLIPALGTCCACSSSSSSSPVTADVPDSDAPMSNVGCTQASGDMYSPGMQKVGAAGRYSFELLSSSPAPPALDDNTFVLQVKDAQGEREPVTGALSVALDMPEHGHPSPKQPDITFDAKSKAFTLDPLRLFMVGLWRFTFSFESESGSAADADSVVLNFCIE